MHIAVPHRTTKAAARAQLELRLGQLLGKFSEQASDLHHEWDGDMLRFRGKARGLSIEGTVEVTDTEVLIEGKLPLLARAFEGKIKQTVELEAEKMFRTA